jgi:hypothetical protein
MRHGKREGESGRDEVLRPACIAAEKRASRERAPPELSQPSPRVFK